MSHPFYRLTAPSRWETAVESLSFSSLRAIERCPRQWQLRRSSWPGFERLPTRPHAAAIEGQIVHEVLDLLFRELCFAGAPPTTSPAFRAVVARVDVPGEIQRRIDATHALLAEHPRRLALRLPLDARSLYNRAAALFQREYAAVARADAAPPPPARGPSPRVDLLGALRARGALTEVPVAHPRLPVRGVIDLVRRDDAGAHVVDFKTGEVRDEHEEQLALYALLWWRVTGDLPVALSLRHPRGQRAFEVSAARLEAIEAALTVRVEATQRAIAETPAPARRGDHCAQCDVRPFCDDYWAALPTPDAQTAVGRRGVDVAVQVPGEVEANGFVAGEGKRRLPLVWEAEGGGAHGPFVAGEVLRIVGARYEDGAVRLVATTEVFHRA
ncbi:MAG: PD-(D/E)XK nuclease family protein [Polyangiales bacterium]